MSRLERSSDTDWNARPDYSEASPSTWLTSCLPDEPAETAGREEESARTEGLRRRERRPTGMTESYLLQSRSYGEKMQRQRQQRLQQRLQHQASDLSSGLLSLSLHKNVGESG